jgi:hypothetical protein
MPCSIRNGFSAKTIAFETLDPTDGGSGVTSSPCCSSSYCTEDCCVAGMNAADIISAMAVITSRNLSLACFIKVNK